MTLPMHVTSFGTKAPQDDAGEWNQFSSKARIGYPGKECLFKLDVTAADHDKAEMIAPGVTHEHSTGNETSRKQRNRTSQRSRLEAHISRPR